MFNLQARFKYNSAFHVIHVLCNKNSKFQCRIGLKLFLRVPRAMGDETTKFGIFLRSFATFSGLIKFPRDVTD
jgi:hypothetical protein